MRKARKPSGGWKLCWTHDIFYNKSEVWIDSEKLYEVLYQFEMEGMNDA